MPQPAIYEPTLLHPEQIVAKKPWERQEGESAKWFFRFRNYLALGSNRSVNAVFDAENKKGQAKASYNPGKGWYNAAKRYQWQIRADAWDNEQDEQKAEQMRQIAMKCAFTSRPYRIAQLDSMADALARQIEKGLEISICLATIKQIQSLMQEIAKEIDAWGVHFDASCDAAALDALKQKYKRMAELEQERWDIMEEEIEHKLQQHIEQEERMKNLKQIREA